MFEKIEKVKISNILHQTRMSVMCKIFLQFELPG
jgi:hypothetical protein